LIRFSAFWKENLTFFEIKKIAGRERGIEIKSMLNENGLI
jgi:hypothetical protein